MRKKIIEWLFGNDWEKYWDLHKKYCKQIDETISVMIENQNLRQRLIEKIEEEQGTAKLALSVCNVNEKLELICEKYGIDINKELELMDEKTE